MLLSLLLAAADGAATLEDAAAIERRCPRSLKPVESAGMPVSACNEPAVRLRTP